MAKKQGLACLTPERRREIARMGQKAARAAGKCYKFDHETAVKAGHIAGSLKRYPYIRPGGGGKRPYTGPSGRPDIGDKEQVTEAMRSGDAGSVRDAIVGEMTTLDQIETQARAMAAVQQAEADLQELTESEEHLPPAMFPLQREARVMAERHAAVEQMAAAAMGSEPTPERPAPKFSQAQRTCGRLAAFLGKKIRD